MKQNWWEDKFRKSVVEEIGLHSEIGLYIPKLKRLISQLLKAQVEQIEAGLPDNPFISPVDKNYAFGFDECRAQIKQSLEDIKKNI